MSVKIRALIGAKPESFEYGDTFVREDVAPVVPTRAAHSRSLARLNLKTNKRCEN